MSCDDELGEPIEHSRRTLSKTLFTLSLCRIAKDHDFGNLLSRLHMHIDDQDEVVLAA
jgi:hypothetical protein